MKYISTRRRAEEISVSRAIIKGIAEDRGLYVPDHFPQLDGNWEALAKLEYTEVVSRVLAPFLPEFEARELEDCVRRAYVGTFEHPKVAPLVRAGNVHFLELYHGKTAAFKDMALSLLPYLLTASIRKEKEDKKIAILAATSGDTGIAALKGFEDVPGTEVIVFFPEEGVSPVQKQQMRTAEGSNTHVAGIEGNFDDAQRGVKQILNDENFAAEALAKGYKLTAANSINIGRLLPQVAYYVWAYARMVESGAVKAGDPVNLVVPSGNFGNLLSGYYAEKMGVPVRRYLCASNRNNVLSDFFRTGVYDARRPLYTTNAPSMDIIVSSNLERLLYDLSGEDGAAVDAWMQALQNEQRYQVGGKTKEGLNRFYGGFATEEEIEAAIGSFYRGQGYLMDTHTAAAYKVYQDYLAETGDDTPAVITATASPYKFAGSVSRALGLPVAEDEFSAIQRLAEKTGVPVPAGLQNLKERPVRHTRTVAPEAMSDTVMHTLK
jgi:threonine synthase